LVRHYRAVLSASHNPGVPGEDFGIKYNVGNGGPARAAVTDAIYDYSRTIAAYHIADASPVELAQLGVSRVQETEVRVVDPVTQY
jgi:phosphoglucomutase